MIHLMSEIWLVEEINLLGSSTLACNEPRQYESSVSEKGDEVGPWRLIRRLPYINVTCTPRMAR